MTKNDTPKQKTLFPIPPEMALKSKKKKKKDRKLPGHYCRVCGRRRANEKFSGKGHAAHICKDCAKEQRAESKKKRKIAGASETEHNLFNNLPTSLAGGGGVDGAIHRRGGPSIMRESNEKYPEGCPTGSAVASGAGNLKAKFVFHAVGPRWSGGNRNEPELLQSAYRRCLELAIEYGCKSIAFPSISTGIYGFPIHQAAPIALQTVIDFLNEKKGGLEIVRFCLFSDADLETYSKALTEAKSTCLRYSS